MIVQPYKTHKIQANEDLYSILDTYLPKIEASSIIVVTSKIVGICEGRVVKAKSLEQKYKLAEQEADYYLPASEHHYGFMMTVNHNLLVISAGIDTSNGNGYLSLWPKDPQKSANDIREYLVKKYGQKHIGVLITDSKLSPLRKGVTGYAITHSGFKAVNSYIGKEDIFGKQMHAEQLNIMDSLSSAAVAVMGEGAEQTPLAVITDVPFVQFQTRNPNKEELDVLRIALQDDIYANMLTAVPWKKGKKEM